MRRVLLTLLVIILILGALGAAGFAGFQYGYQRSIAGTTNGEVPAPAWSMGPRGMQPRAFGFHHGFGRDGFGMMRPGIGFGFLGPLFFLARIAFWGLVIWAIYMLITRSGWRLTRTTPVAPPPAPVEPPVVTSEPENKE